MGRGCGTRRDVGESLANVEVTAATHGASRHRVGARVKALQLDPFMSRRTWRPVARANRYASRSFAWGLGLRLIRRPSDAVHSSAGRFPPRQLNSSP